MTIRNQYRGKHCPACGAIPSAWKKVPRSLVLFGDLDSGGRRKKSVPADRACDYDPVDLIHCESCGFMGTVVQHPEDAEGFIDWDDWEFRPKFCPNCGKELDDGE